MALVPDTVVCHEAMAVAFSDAVARHGSACNAMMTNTIKCHGDTVPLLCAVRRGLQDGRPVEKVYQATDCRVALPTGDRLNRVH
jgi:hypothetical protein